MSAEDRSPPARPAGKLPGGLLHVDDRLPGIRRVRRGKDFVYLLPDDRRLTDPAELERIRRLAIPPAYTDVWICPLPNGHLQATGRDAKGRKQYRYHADWQRQRGSDKFARLQAFGQALPRIRRRVARDLGLVDSDEEASGSPPEASDSSPPPPSSSPDSPPLPRQLVLATLVRLLDTTFMRIGNDEYARRNRSYGLSTLLSRHAAFAGGQLRLRFRGKSGVMHEVEVADRRVVRVVRRCKQLPGQELFQYLDAQGETHAIGSGDVNDYIAEAAGERFTAKDFRTWHGTVQALELMRIACAGERATALDAQRILKEVARRLGNTVAVCRRAYIHPAVLELGEQLARDQEAASHFEAGGEATGSAPRGLHAAEARLLRFLAERSE